MITSISRVFASLVTVLILAGCQNTPPAPTPGGSLPDTVLDSYYAGQSDPAYEYFQHSSIQRFLAMWVKEETKDIEHPVWDLNSFTQISMVDQNFQDLHPGETIYYCTFSDGADRFGYVILQYDAQGPSVSNYGVTETTPYVYDLKANEAEIAAALQETDLDLSTAKASRVYLFDKAQKRADQVIRFTDGKGDAYLCSLGDAAFPVEKQQG